jgi:glycosyltransferase involved in cell wall biosynthesis
VHALLKLGPLGRVLARRIGRGATTIGLASSELRARFLTLAPELAPRAEVIPMGVEPPPPIDRAAARRALGLSRPTLLALGRLVPIKGFDRAIDAVAGRTDVELVIAGEGPERSRLEQRARMRRAPTRFVGVITGEEKALWLAAADALIVPSRILSSGRSDTAPVVAREALAAGLPVIGSELPGLREIVGEAGILCENDAALAVAIDRLATLRGRLEPRARARGARWTWAAVTPTIEARLLSSPPSSALASSPAGPIEGAPAKGVSNGLRSVHWDGERAGPRWFTGGPIASTPKTDDAFQRMRDQGSTRSAEAGSTKEKTDPGSATSSS